MTDQQRTQLLRAAHLAREAVAAVQAVIDELTDGAERSEVFGAGCAVGAGAARLLALAVPARKTRH